MDNCRKLVFTTQIPIRWGDMDALGHVNNTIYFRYAEEARSQWMKSLMAISDMAQDGAPLPISASCTFLIPLVYPGTVEVRIFTGLAGRSSLMTYFDMRPRGDDKLFAEGAVKLVWTSLTTGKSIPIPDVLLRLFAET